jgi:hypothetical protein
MRVAAVQLETIVNRVGGDEPYVSLHFPGAGSYTK